MTLRKTTAFRNFIKTNHLNEINRIKSLINIIRTSTKAINAKKNLKQDISQEEQEAEELKSLLDTEIDEFRKKYKIPEFDMEDILGVEKWFIAKLQEGQILNDKL